MSEVLLTTNTTKSTLVAMEWLFGLYGTVSDGTIKKRKEYNVRKEGIELNSIIPLDPLHCTENIDKNTYLAHP
ncbi:MAG: hypothetical protein ACI90V_011165 [Bacillariaceae sp.]|jgi:hypothetical protein